MAKETVEIGSEDVATLDTVGESKAISLSREKLRLRLARDTFANSDAMERIGDEIATAETVDDILEAGNVVHAEEFLDVAMDIRGFVLRPSSEEYIKDSDGQSESFAVMDVVVIDSTVRHYSPGDVLILVCGGYNVQNALVRYAELNGEQTEGDQAGLFNHPLRCALRQAGRALRLYKPQPAQIADAFQVVEA